MAEIRTERGLDRLVNFSDATVAIAITILILPLVDVSSKITDMTLWEFLRTNSGEVIGFVISFWVIGRFWMVHHRVFEWVDSYSTGLLWANLLWMAGIVTVPFAANLLANAQNGRGDVYGFYIGSMVVTSGAMVLIEYLLMRNPALLTERGRGQVDLVRACCAPLLLLVATVLASLYPNVGMFWVLLMLLSTPLYLLLNRVFGRRGSQSGS
ncbi:TMEM175 family protein [Leifsonia poae]|uniref:TMEM175 family protein n=1 Tax=Leifsonia poae TaxID=110933 RepID=UPI001CBC401A|nr:TMEM175 family protein [Leifsonia poae]